MDLTGNTKNIYLKQNSNDIKEEFKNSNGVDFTTKAGFSANLNDLGLNTKQIAFVKAFVKNHTNPADAYLSVYQGVKRGAASSAASRLLAKPSIREAVTRQIFFTRNLEKIDKVFVVKTLKELAQRCIEDDDRKYLIESLNMLNKLAGFYQENKQPGIQINTSNISFGGWNPNEPTGKILPQSSFDNTEIDTVLSQSSFEDTEEVKSSQDFQESEEDLEDYDSLDNDDND